MTLTLPAHADQTRNASVANLNLGTAWSSGTVPGTGDVALWDASSALTNTMGANNTWGGLNISAASGAVAIGGANTLLLDHSTDLNTVFNPGANNFTWGAAGTGGSFNINGAAGSTSSTAQGATFAGSGLVTISSTATKNWSTNGTSNGVTNVTFSGTLALRGATIPAVGSLTGNWLALGGGGGAASAIGTLTQTGAFALDTGDATSCGNYILSQGFSGQFLKLKNLQGTGSIRADWGISAGTQTRGIELDQSGDTVLSGSILAHNGSSQRRNVTLLKKGTGKLTLTGGLGTSGGVASLNFDIQAGALQLGDGATNPIFVNAASWDAASTFNVAAGAKLRFMSSSNFTWTRALTGGTGTVEITSDGDPFEGSVTFTANNSAFGGNVDLLAGSLRIGPNLGSGSLTLRSGTSFTCALAATNGTSQVGSLVLEGGTESDFRLGTINDSITMAGALTPPASGSHVINILNLPTAGGAIKLFDYSGTPLTETEFARFELGLIPPGIAGYQLVNNTAGTSIDLLITLEDQIWTGSVDGNWNSSTNNWVVDGTPGTPVAYDPERGSVFKDGPVTSSVVVGAGINPTKVTFNNSVTAYSFTGDGILGTCGLIKNGTSSTILAQANSYSGNTSVNQGKLQIGDGGTTGDIGSGPVTVSAGATLEFKRSNAVPGTADLDYKTSPKMRNVSGAGGITLSGGGIFFNYPGVGLGFAEANTWAAFSGDLSVNGGSEFQTIRNGATAMGSGNVILGDGASSGILSQIEGNWTWTNNIQLVGESNKILNRSSVGPRTLKLQGILSGSGGLSLEDPAAGMSVVNRGFILTGANTMNGTLTIAAGVPVRVGGVPGATDVGQSGADAFGSLGGATVVNNGTLTFSRTDAHSAANAISGTGALRIGIPVADGFGNTSTQTLTYTGTASHTGATTVNNGTLIVGTGGSLGGSSVSVSATGILGGVGTVAAPLTVAGTIAPGTGVGTLPVSGDTVLTGTLAIEVDGAAVDKLSVTGSLDLTGSTLTLAESGAGFTAASYVVAECTGTLTGLPIAPVGYTVSAVGQQVVLSKVTASDYGTWIGSFVFGPGADLTPSGDPDGDGLTNQEEYAFGLAPNSGASVNPVIAPLDRNSAAFTYTRRDNALTLLTYKVWTSTNLSVWTEDASATQNDSAGPNVGGVESVVVTLSGGGPLTAPKLFVRVTAE